MGGEVTEGKRPSKEEMEEDKVGVVGGGVGMEERTGMEGRMEEKRSRQVKGEGWKKETKLCCV
jgi:hypothetical protein